MRLSRDNLIVLGILVVITVTYALVIYRAQSSALAELEARAAETRRQLSEQTVKAERMPPMIRQIELMKQRYNKDWDRRLPQRKELAEFLREIAANLAEENLANEMIRPGNPSRGPLYNCLPITMKFEGDFLSLANFLRRVDKMTRLTRIERLEIQPGKDHRKLPITLGMNIYFTEQ
jgi:Tfp pilus assembly protein PilO